MIIRNYANGSIGLLIPADNRPQTMDRGPQAVHGPQLTQLNYKLYFIPLLVKKRIIRLIIH